MSERGACVRVALLGVAFAAVLAAGCGRLIPGGSAVFEDARLAPWMRETESLRELEFLEPVRVEWIDSSEVPRITHAEMMAGLPEGHVVQYRDAYAALGLLPPDLDLLDTLLQLHQDQLVGLYSTRLKTMYVVGQPPSRAVRPSYRSLLRRRQERIEPTPQNQILVHELVHALQHQHFVQTVHLLENLRRNDDAISGIVAAMEGDASLTMLGVSAHLERNLHQARRLGEAMQVDLDHPTGALATVPRLLAASLIFPYARGVVLAAREWEAFGNTGLNQLLEDPPLSTTRIYFPEDVEPVEFLGLPRQALEAALAERECRLGLDNVAGALTLEVLFEDHGGEQELRPPPGEGEEAGVAPLLSTWSGDRFVHVTCPESLDLIWHTRWDDAAAAGRFAAAYAGMAPSVTRSVGWSGTPTIQVRGRSVVIASRNVEDLIPLVLDDTEIRSYDTFQEWVADDCFPESPCPVREAEREAEPEGVDAAGRAESRDGPGYAAVEPAFEPAAGGPHGAARADRNPDDERD